MGNNFLLIVRLCENSKKYDVDYSCITGSSANPKDRLKEEKDMIVLSPQRRSFGTGCHVSQQPLLQRAISNMETDRER